MQININECRISRYSVTKIGLNITLQIKNEDLSLEQRELLRHLYEDGTCLKNDLTSIEEEIKEEPKEVKTISDAKYLRDLCVQFAGGGGQGRDYYEQFKRERGVEHLSELPEEKIQEEIRNFENILQINQ